jgi:hypothetical protein
MVLAFCCCPSISLIHYGVGILPESWPSAWQVLYYAARRALCYGIGTIVSEFTLCSRSRLPGCWQGMRKGYR